MVIIGNLIIPFHPSYHIFGLLTTKCFEMCETSQKPVQYMYALCLHLYVCVHLKRV